MMMKKISLFIMLLLLFAIPAHAQSFAALSGTCPGEESEEELEIGDVLSGRLRRDDVVWYSFEAEEGDIWRIEMLGDSRELFRVGILDPETRQNEDFEEFDLAFNYLIADEPFISAFRPTLDGVYCLMLRNEDTDTINYEISLEPFERDGDELVGTDELDDYGLNTVGIWYYVQAEYETALDFFEQSIELDDQDEVVQRNACTTAFLLGRYEDAIEFCDESIDINRDYVDAYYYRSFANRALGEYEDAEEDFDELIDLQPDDADWYFERSVNFMLLGDGDDALDDMEEYIDVSGVDNPYWLGVALLFADEIDDAEDAFLESEEAVLDADNIPVYQYFWLAVIADLNGEDDDVVEDYLDDTLDGARSFDEFERNRIEALVALMQDDMDSAQEIYQEVLDESGFAHDRIYDLVYIRLLNQLYPDNSNFFALQDWFETELGQ